MSGERVSVPVEMWGCRFCHDEGVSALWPRRQDVLDHVMLHHADRLAVRVAVTGEEAAA